MTITKELLDHIVTSGLFTGYQQQIGGIRDDLPAFKSAKKWLVVRRAGGGQIDPLFGNPIFKIQIGGSTSNTQEFEEKADLLIDFMNTNYQSGNVVDIVVISDVTGPLPLQNDRVYFDITVQIHQNRV